MSKVCVLEIKDEVNVRFKGLDVATRRALQSKLKYFLPYAKHMPSYKLGRWDGTMSYCDVGGRSYVNLLEDLLPLVYAANYTIEIEDNRKTYDFSFDDVKEDSYSHISWPKGHVHEGKPIMIRDHQLLSINKYLHHPQALQEVSTGAGKTLITAILCDKISAYGRSVVIVPNKDLVTQTERDFKLLGLDVGVYFGDRKEPGRTHTICTWQSIDALDRKNKNYDPTLDLSVFTEDVAGVVVDECFAGHSKVKVPGGWKEIRDIEIGDTVMNYNEESGVFKNDTVIDVYRNMVKSSSEKMYSLEFDNGKVVEVTGNHKFLTESGWVRADELTENHEIIDINKNTGII